VEKDKMLLQINQQMDKINDLRDTVNMKTSTAAIQQGKIEKLEEKI